MQSFVLKTLWNNITYELTDVDSNQLRIRDLFYQLVEANIIDNVILRHNQNQKDCSNCAYLKLGIWSECWLHDEFYPYYIILPDGTLSDGERFEETLKQAGFVDNETIFIVQHEQPCSEKNTQKRCVERKALRFRSRMSSMPLWIYTDIGNDIVENVEMTITLSELFELYFKGKGYGPEEKKNCSLIINGVLYNPKSSKRLSEIGITYGDVIQVVVNSDYNDIIKRWTKRHLIKIRRKE